MENVTVYRNQVFPWVPELVKLGFLWVWVLWPIDFGVWEDESSVGCFLPFVWAICIHLLLSRLSDTWLGVNMCFSLSIRLPTFINFYRYLNYVGGLIWKLINGKKTQINVTLLIVLLIKITYPYFYRRWDYESLISFFFFNDPIVG